MFVAPSAATCAAAAAASRHSAFLAFLIAQEESLASPRPAAQLTAAALAAADIQQPGQAADAGWSAGDTAVAATSTEKPLDSTRAAASDDGGSSCSSSSSVDGSSSGSSDASSSGGGGGGQGVRTGVWFDVEQGEGQPPAKMELLEEPVAEVGWMCGHECGGKWRSMGGWLCLEGMCMPCSSKLTGLILRCPPPPASQRPLVAECATLGCPASTAGLPHGGACRLRRPCPDLGPHLQEGICCAVLPSVQGGKKSWCMRRQKNGGAAAGGDGCGEEQPISHCLVHGSTPLPSLRPLPAAVSAAARRPALQRVGELCYGVNVVLWQAGCSLPHALGWLRCCMSCSPMLRRPSSNFCRCTAAAAPASAGPRIFVSWTVAGNC